jgi:hypothetical protein
MQFNVPCVCGRRLTVTAGDAGATLPCECGRMVEVPGLQKLRTLPRVPADEPTILQSTTIHAQLTGVDLAICLLVPIVGFVAGVLRLIRGEPTAGRMLLISGVVLGLWTLFVAAMRPAPGILGR